MASPTPSPDTSEFEPAWQRNLFVCLFGAFTTVLAMTLMLPFLPLYVEQLGVSGHAAIVQWSGVAYAATFFTAGLVAPLWGHLGDRFGRKSMLLRASLGMAIVMSLMGVVGNIWQLVALRLLTGLAGGYASGASILVAVQTPKSRSAWALGMLSTGVMAGNLAGPLLGGVLPQWIGIRATFFCAGGLILLAFFATALLVRETVKPDRKHRPKATWAALPRKGLVLSLLFTGLLLLIANMSVEPIITVFVQELIGDPTQVTLVSGLAMAAAALGSVLSAPRLGRVADRIGHGKVVVFALGAAGLLLIPQAFVHSGWLFIALRFAMGLALGGLLPSVNALLRHNVPDTMIGMVMGLSISFQYTGQVLGPVLGGLVGGHIGMRSVFIATSALLLMGAAYHWRHAGFGRWSQASEAPHA